MISINYAKKNGNGYIINFYADTAEDINNFDPTKPFGIYGIPQNGSVITLVGGADSANYYLNGSGNIVKIEVGGGPTPPTPVFTLFEVAQSIRGIDFGNVQNGDMSADLNNFLASLDGQYTIEGALPLVTLPDENYLFALDMSQFSGSGYAIILGDQEVYATNANPHGDVRTTAGFQNLTDGKCLLSGAVDVLEVNGAISTPWNGILFGAVEA